MKSIDFVRSGIIGAFTGAGIFALDYMGYDSPIAVAAGAFVFAGGAGYYTAKVFTGHGDTIHMKTGLSIGGLTAAVVGGLAFMDILPAAGIMLAVSGFAAASLTDAFIGQTVF